MRMTRISRFAFPAYLLLEAFVTLEVAARLGAGLTLALLILGAAAGIAVLRQERLAVLTRLRRSLGAGQPLVPELFDSALRAAAGILLIVPGFLSDAAALALLSPPLRRMLLRRWRARFGQAASGPVVIDGSYRRIDDPRLPEPEQDPR